MEKEPGLKIVDAFDLDPADDLDPLEAHLVQGPLDDGNPHHVHQQVGGEVAGGGDHLVRELVHAHGPAQVCLELGVGLPAQLQHVGPPVHDARELVADVDGGVARQLAARDLAEDGKQDRELHGGRGVEGRVRVVGPLQGRLAVVEGDAQGLQPVLLLDLENAAVEGDLGRGHRFGRGDPGGPHGRILTHARRGDPRAERQSGSKCISSLKSRKRPSISARVRRRRRSRLKASTQKDASVLPMMTARRRATPSPGPRPPAAPLV